MNLLSNYQIGIYNFKLGAYEYILTLDETIFENLISKGILRSNLKRDLDIYKYYSEQRIFFNRMQSITNTADNFNVSEDTVYRTIRKMK